MAQDDSLRSHFQPPDWLTARPRPLVSSRGGAPPPPPGSSAAAHGARPVEGTREVPPVPDLPPALDAGGVPPLPPPPADVDPRPPLRTRPEDVDRPEEACEIPVTRDMARDRAENAEPSPEAEPFHLTSEPAPAATPAEVSDDPDLTARLRAWQRVDQDLYRLLGYEETERLVFRDEAGDLVEAPGSGKLAGQLGEAKFEISRIEAAAFRDKGLWGTAALVALLVTGLLGMVDWLSPFWTFVVVFLVSSFGRLRRRWRRRLDKVAEDHRLTYELVRQRLQPPT